MSEYQITSWRVIPSMVVAREGEKTVKAQLPMRFQEAIDEAAMRMGEADADSYMNGWTGDSIRWSRCNSRIYRCYSISSKGSHSVQHSDCSTDIHR